MTLFHRIKKCPLKYSHLFCGFWRIYEFFFKIPKIQKSYNMHAIFLRVVWWSKRWKWSLKSQKTRFFQAFFSTGKRLEKKRGFCDFKVYFHLFDQTTLKNIAWILYDFCIFGILKKSRKFFKIGKTSGNTLIFWDP